LGKKGLQIGAVQLQIENLNGYCGLEQQPQTLHFWQQNGFYEFSKQIFLTLSHIAFYLVVVPLEGRQTIKKYMLISL